MIVSDLQFFPSSERTLKNNHSNSTGMYFVKMIITTIITNNRAIKNTATPEPPTAIIVEVPVSVVNFSNRNIFIM